MRRRRKEKSEKISADAKTVPNGIPLEHCFQAQQDNILKLRQVVAEDLEKCGDIGTQTDDLFLLRFLLNSRGNVPQAAKNIRSCIQYRQQYREEIEYVRKHGRVSSAEELFPYMSGGWFGTFGELGYPVSIVRLGVSDPKGLMNAFGPEQMKDFLIVTSEVGFQLADANTRRTRHLVKCFRVVDMSGFSLKKYDRRFTAVQTDINKALNSMYPQLIAKIIMINTNVAFRTLWSMVKPFLPSSMLEKQTVCPAVGTSKPNADIDRCPFVRRMKCKHEVPDFLGGACKIPMHFFGRDEPRPYDLAKVYMPPYTQQLLLEKTLNAPAKFKVSIELRSRHEVMITIASHDKDIETNWLVSSKDGLVSKEYHSSSATQVHIMGENFSNAPKRVDVLLELVS